MDSRLYRRKITPEVSQRATESGLIKLIRTPYGKNPRTEQEVTQALGFSSPFLDLIRHIREEGDLDSAAIIDIGPEFKAKFRDDASRIPNGQKMHWQKEALRRTPDILTDAGLDTDLEQVLNGWHSVWTHTRGTFTAIGSITDGPQTTQISKQEKLLRQYGHDEFGNNVRYDSSELEEISGFRPGRFSIFLGDDARPNFPSIILDRTYNQETTNPDEFVFFTVHSSFFFLCKRSDLTKWLKSAEAREAFKVGEIDPLRIEGFKFPATERDLKLMSTLSSQSLDDMLHGLKKSIPEKVPTDRVPNALAGKVAEMAKRTIGATAQSHLEWRNDEILELLK